MSRERLAGALIALVTAACGAASPARDDERSTATIVVLPDPTSEAAAPSASAPSAEPSSALVPQEAPDAADGSCPPKPTIQPQAAGVKNELAVEIVFDRSGSTTGLLSEKTKEGAARFVQLMRPTDYIGVIAFDSSPTELLPIQPRGDGSKARSVIAQTQPGGGTELSAALAMAIDRLGAVTDARRVILVVTDGFFPVQCLGGLLATAEKGGLTMTAIALGADADETFLKGVASAGSGRFYAIPDANDLPIAFEKEHAVLMTTR